MMPDKSSEKEIELAVAIRKLELQYGLFLRTSEWIFFSENRPEVRDGIFATINPDELGVELEKRVDAETGAKGQAQ